MPVQLYLYADRLLLQPLEGETLSSGGVILPDTVKGEKIKSGRVLAVGPGRFIDQSGERQPVNGLYDRAIQPGDVVLYHLNAGIPFKQDGVELLILAEQDIQAVVDNKEEDLSIPL